MKRAQKPTPGQTRVTRPCGCNDCLECELRAMRARARGETPRAVRIRERRAAQARLDAVGAWS